MLIRCDRKGCLANTEAKLNVSTSEVICGDCEQEIKNVSAPMKSILKSQGQVVRHEEQRAFMMACMSCYANREVVKTSDNNTVCGICGENIMVQPAMGLAMEEAGVRMRRLTAEEEAMLFKKNKKTSATQKSNDKAVKSKPVRKKKAKKKTSVNRSE